MLTADNDKSCEGSNWTDGMVDEAWFNSMVDWLHPGLMLTAAYDTTCEDCIWIIGMVDVDGTVQAPAMISTDVDLDDMPLKQNLQHLF